MTFVARSQSRAFVVRDRVVDQATHSNPLGLDGIAWQSVDRVLWHNGGSGGFSAFVAFDKAENNAVGILANFGGRMGAVDRAGFRAVGVRNPLAGG